MPAQLINDQQNFLAQNRATLVITAIPNTRFYIQDFNLPDISLGTGAVMDTPLSQMKFAGDHLRYDDLTITFLVQENLEDWLLLHNWIRGLGKPENFDEYKNKPIDVSDATLTIYNNHQNPTVVVKFIDLVPNFLGGISFSTENTETVPMKARAGFSVQRYNVAKYK